MVSLEEAVNMVTALPNVTEGTRWGRRTWSVGKHGVAWERPLSKADLKRLGGQPPPEGPILALTVEDLGAKESILTAAPKGIFTIAHFDGYPAILVQLEFVEKTSLHELIEEAWLASVSPSRADEYLAAKRPSTTAVSAEPLDRLRAICFALPEVTERLSHGEPTFFVQAKKTFVMTVDDHHGDGNRGFWCAAPPGAQIELVAQDPLRFFVPPYVGGRGWVGVRFDDPGTDWSEIAELVDQAYRCVAPKKLVSALSSVSTDDTQRVGRLNMTRKGAPA